MRSVLPESEWYVTSTFTSGTGSSADASPEPLPSITRRAHRNRKPMRRNREIEMRGKDIDSQREGAGARDRHRLNDERFLLPSVLQQKLPSTFRDSHTYDSEPAILQSTFPEHMTADTSGKQTHLSRNALSASLSYAYPLLSWPR